MSIEEKAKRYDNVIEKLRKFYRDYDTVSCLIDVKEELANLFPEIEESNDERIRKELLEHCKNQAEPYIQTGNKCPQIQSWIAWLEKQCKYKPTDTCGSSTINGKEFPAGEKRDFGYFNESDYKA